MHDKVKNVIGLVRVSTKEQAEDVHAGIARQREVINHTIQTKNLNCRQIIELNDVSGTNMLRCPEVIHLLKNVESKQVQGVVLADLDRLLRPARFEDFALLQVFQDSGATIYCGDQEINLTTDAGYLMGGFQALMAGNELRTLKRRVQGAKEQKRKQGKCPSAAITLPRGISYDRKLEKWGYTPEVAQVIEAFRLLDEDGITNLCDLARRTGINHRTLHNLLQNRIYIGERVYDKKRGDRKYASENGRQADRQKVNRTGDEIITVRVIDQPAVNPERFERVQRILANKGMTWAGSRSNSSPRLLTAIGRCGECGAILYGSSNGGRKRNKPGYYICKKNYYLYRSELGSCVMHNIRQDVADEKVAHWVSEKLSDRKVLGNILALYEQTQESSIAEMESQVGNVEQALAELDEKVHRLNKGYLDKKFTDAEHAQYKAEFEAEREKLTAIRFNRPENSSVSEIKRRLLLLTKGALAFARINDRNMQKAVIQQLLAELHVGNKGITGFKIRPQFDALVCDKGTRTGRGSLLPRA